MCRRHIDFLYAGVLMYVALPLQLVAGGVHSFAAGRGDSGLTLGYVDKDSAFCEQARTEGQSLLACTVGEF
jgi:hypothetical protein